MYFNIGLFQSNASSSDQVSIYIQLLIINATILSAWNKNTSRLYIYVYWTSKSQEKEEQEQQKLVHKIKIYIKDHFSLSNRTKVLLHTYMAYVFNSIKAIHALSNQINHTKLWIVLQYRLHYSHTFTNTGTGSEIPQVLAIFLLLSFIYLFR